MKPCIFQICTRCKKIHASVNAGLHKDHQPRSPQITYSLCGRSCIFDCVSYKMCSILSHWPTKLYSAACKLDKEASLVCTATQYIHQPPQHVDFEIGHFRDNYTITTPLHTSIPLLFFPPHKGNTREFNWVI